jgi:hypothetical protein
MAFNGSGVFNRIFSWGTDKTNLVPVTASRMDQEMDGFATGLSNCITKDGQQTLTATIPWNSQGLTGVGTLTVTGSGASTSTSTGAAVITGGLGVGGAVYIGGALNATASTASTSTTTGAAIVTGGAGVGGRVSADNFRATNQPCFSAHKNTTNQTGIVNGTFTKVTFGTELFDIGSFYDASTSRWTPPAGVVNIVASTYMDTNLIASNIYIVSVYKNGVRYKDSHILSGGGGVTLAAPVINIIDRANGTDFYEIFVFGSTASTFNVNGQISATYFMGWQL